MIYEKQLMLILTNCLAQTIDEGCLKLANSLIKRIKRNDDTSHIVTYERESTLSDEHLHLNKLFLSLKLKKTLKVHGGHTLFVPFPAKPWKNAWRIFVLSKLTQKNISVLLIMQDEYGKIAKLLLKRSGAELITFSTEATRFYGSIVGKNKVKYMKAGVDTNVFLPVTEQEARALKLKYGLDENKPVILHVGHLQDGRNLRELLKLSKTYQILLVASTFNKDNQNKELYEELLVGGIKVIDEYCLHIEEIYQLSDVYFFPVKDRCNCIDIPLSCMEAAACGKPVVTTAFGEMAEFKGSSGFYFIDSFEACDLNALIEKALIEKNTNVRAAVLDYDWDKAIGFFV